MRTRQDFAEDNILRDTVAVCYVSDNSPIAFHRHIDGTVIRNVFRYTIWLIVYVVLSMCYAALLLGAILQKIHLLCYYYYFLFIPVFFYYSADSVAWCFCSTSKLLLTYLLLTSLLSAAFIFFFYFPLITKKKSKKKSFIV